METRVQKWGNSLAIRIPKAFAAEVGLAQDRAVELTVEGGALVLRPLEATRYELESLLARVSEDNLHGPADWGEPVGREEW